MEKVIMWAIAAVGGSLSLIAIVEIVEQFAKFFNQYSIFFN